MGNYLQKKNILDEFKTIKSLRDAPDSYFVCGKRIRVINNKEYVKCIQSLWGGWDESMTECINQVCTVVNVDHDKAINVLTVSKKKWLLNRAALEPYDPKHCDEIQFLSVMFENNVANGRKDEISSLSESPTIDEQIKPDGQLRDKKTETLITKEFKVGDLLRVSSNEKLIQEKQQYCGGYSRMRMRDLIGKLVQVKHYNAKCVKVEKEGRDYDLHPDILDYPKSAPDKEIIPKKESAVVDRNAHFFTAITENDAEKLFQVIDKDTLNVQNHSGRTPVNLACYLGKLDMVKLLIEFGADLNIPDNNGNLPIHNCANKGHDEILRYILRTFPDQINKKTQNGLTLLNIAKAKKNKILETFLLASNIDASTRISQSVNNDFEISLLYPPMTLTNPNEDEISVKYPTENLSASLMDPPKDGREFETIELPSHPIIRSSMANSRNSSINNSPPVENECMICRDGQLNTAFVQCGHLACNVCADRIFRCHICQRDIEKKIFIYLS